MRPFFIMFFVIAFKFSFAQKYQSIFDNMDSLIILSSNPGEGLNESITIKSDTTSSEYFKIVFEHNYPDRIIDNNSNFYSENLYLREDSMNSRLYIYSKDSDLEYLIMDLNLYPKDTFETDNGKILIVDSVFFENDLKVIQFENQKEFGMLYQTINIRLKFIESIGPNWSFFYPFNNENLPSLLLCSYKDNQITYKNPDNFDCEEFWRVGIDEINKPDILKITDESSFSKIIIDSDNLFDLYVFDSGGNQVIKQKDIHRETLIKLTINGVFILKIVTNNNVYTRKIINKNYW